MTAEVTISFTRVMEALAGPALCAAADSSCQPQQDLLPAYADVAVCSEDSASFSEPEQRIHRRSASCSAIMEPSTVCLQDTSLSGSHASSTSAASTPAVDTLAQAQVREKRRHKHKHKHHHHHHHSEQNQQQQALPPQRAAERMVRSASVDESHSSHASSSASHHSNSTGLVAVIEERRPK